MTINRKYNSMKMSQDIAFSLLKIRKAEKNFLLYNQSQYLKELLLSLKKMHLNIMAIKKDIITDIGYQNYKNTTDDIGEYNKIINNLLNSQTLKNNSFKIEYMRNIGRRIEKQTESILEKEHGDIEKIIIRYIKVLYIIFIIITILILILTIKFTSDIIYPIRNLELAAHKIAEGDFSDIIKVKKGKDEIALLQHTFEQMKIKLEQTLNNLKKAIGDLHVKQEELLKAGKLALLGTLSASVAHEINNPLAIINEKAGLIKDLILLNKNTQNRKKIADLCGSIAANVERCRLITHRLLGFAHRLDVIIETFDLNGAIKETSTFLEKEILYKNITVRWNTAKNLPQITSDKGQLQQVFLNILKNAADALDDHGIISIKSYFLKKRKTACIEIKDNGPGIPHEKLKYIFKPFFTTKSRGKGTGLGLFISYEIIKILHGRLSLKSEYRKGTLFKIEVPENYRRT